MDVRNPTWEEGTILWGLTDQNTDEEITAKAFDLVHEVRWISTATVNEGQPENRIIDYSLLSDGGIYFMTSKGKPFYKQLSARPEIVMNALINGLSALKIRAFVEEVPPAETAVWDEFFDFNPGTKKMYRKNFDIVALYRLVKGEGEMFHLYAEEKIRRLRFAFGGMEKLPMNYAITDACTGCGSCMENCVEQAIYKGEDGKCHIRAMDCNDCGICYTKCPLAGTAMTNRLEG